MMQSFDNQASGPLQATEDPYVSQLLGRLKQLYSERNAVYKDNYKMVGRIMAAMFPEGVTLKTVEDFNRWHIFELAIVKLSRYAVQYQTGGHADSIEDKIVYLAMLAGIDREQFGQGLGNKERA